MILDITISDALGWMISFSHGFICVLLYLIWRELRRVGARR